MYGIKGNDISIDLQNYGIESCTTEISNIRNAQEVNIKSLSSIISTSYMKRTIKELIA